MDRPGPPLVAGLTGTTLTHGGLAAGETYYYIIRPAGDAGKWSPWVEATLPASQTSREKETPAD